MKKYGQKLAALLICLIVNYAYADDNCSNLVNGHMDALETAVSLKMVNQEHLKKVEKELIRISILRESKSDCELVELIPNLKANNKALATVDKALQQ